MRRVWIGFYVTCNTCGRRNRPDKSPREGIRKALLGTIPPCKGCGKVLRPTLSDRPLVHEVRRELIREGLLTVEVQGDEPVH